MERSIDFLQGVFETQLGTACSARLGAAGTGLHLVARLCLDINASATWLEAEPTDQDYSGSLRSTALLYPDGDVCLDHNGEDSTDRVFEMLFDVLGILDDGNSDVWMPFTVGEMGAGGQVKFDLAAIIAAYDSPENGA